MSSEKLAVQTRTQKEELVLSLPSQANLTQNNVQTDPNLLSLLQGVSPSNKECLTIMQQIYQQVSTCLGPSRGSLIHILLQKNLLESLLSILSDENTLPAVNEAAMDLLTLIVKEDNSAESNDVGSLLVQGSISSNPVVAEACRNAFIKWIEIDSKNVASLNQNIVFLGAANLLLTELPDDEEEQPSPSTTTSSSSSEDEHTSSREKKLASLDQKIRLVQFLTFLLYHRVIFPQVGSCIAAAQELKDRMEAADPEDDKDAEGKAKMMEFDDALSVFLKNASGCKSIPDTENTVKKRFIDQIKEGYSSAIEQTSTQLSQLIRTELAKQEKRSEQLQKELEALKSRVATPFPPPIGSVLFMAVTENPNLTYPGTTWQKLRSGYYIRTCESNPTSTGGSNRTGETTLNADQIPSHTHSFQGNEIVGSATLLCPTARTSTSGAFRFSDDHWGRGYKGSPAPDTRHLQFRATPSGNIGHTGGNHGHSHTFEPAFMDLVAWKRTA